MNQGFESSAAGRLNADAVLECGVCWTLYDPAQGDETRGVLPGTPFTALPADWRCPACDASKDKFMLKDPGAATDQPVVDTSLEARIAALGAAYQAAEAAMIGLPVHNPALIVEMVGFRAMSDAHWGDAFVGVAVTPWCMNVVVLPSDPTGPAPGPLGGTRACAFPSGVYSFVAGRMDGVGVFETCSLFSPMDEFDDPAVARLAAEAAIDGLFTAPEPEEASKGPEVSRRFLFTTSRSGPDAPAERAAQER